MNRRASLIVFITFTWVIVVSFCCESPVADARPQDPQETPNAQTTCLDGQGIHFKVPSSWRACLHGVNYESADHAAVSFIWRNPSNEGLNVTIVTFKGGFTLTHGEPATAAQKLDEEYGLLITDSRRPNPPAHYVDLRKHELSGVAGFFFTTRFAALEELGQPSEEVNWRGYRVYNGKTQEINIEVDSSAHAKDLVRTIFDSANVEQDRPATER